MKKLIPFFAACLIMHACRNNSISKADETVLKSAEIGEAVAKPSDIDGLWTGGFYVSSEDSILQKKAEDFEKAYYNKKYGTGVDAGYDEEESGIFDLNDIPAELRKAYFMEPLNGYYTWRAPNKISLVISGMNDSGVVIGRSICAGNERQLRGTYTKNADGFSAELKEPGDEKNDGVFHIAFSTTSKKATGTWTSSTGEVKKCEFENKDFVYSATAGNIDGFRQKNKNGWLEFKKNPSVDLLSAKDVENLTKPELTILRNLIYARHGYTFANASIRNYFEREDWYVPFKKDIRSDLSDVEKKNADKLKSYEKYASAAYDEFGR